MNKILEDTVNLERTFWNERDIKGPAWDSAWIAYGSPTSTNCQLFVYTKEITVR